MCYILQILLYNCKKYVTQLIYAHLLWFKMIHLQNSITNTLSILTSSLFIYILPLKMLRREGPDGSPGTVWCVNGTSSSATERRTCI